MALRQAQKKGSRGSDTAIWSQRQHIPEMTTHTTNIFFGEACGRLVDNATRMGSPCSLPSSPVEVGHGVIDVSQLDP